MLKAHYDVIQCISLFGRNFAEIREPQQTASETFRIFSEMHRNIEKDGLTMLKAVKPVLSDLGTYLTKAIPDTKLTIRRYADAKFTYLSYCLKVKELDDEEHTYAALQDPLYRVETGNYEYRLILRCRQEARAKFASLRNDVLEKLELLESKHAQDLVNHLRKLIKGLATYSSDILVKLQAHPNLFPIEVDLKPSAFQYKSNQAVKFEDDDGQVDEEIPIEMGIEALSPTADANARKTGGQAALISGFEEINLNDSPSNQDNVSTETNSLLIELGIADIDLSVPSSMSLQPQSQNHNKPQPAADEHQQQLQKVQQQMTIESSLDWLADDTNAFSIDAIDDVFKFNTHTSQNHIENNGKNHHSSSNNNDKNRNNVNLLD